MIALVLEKLLANIHVCNVDCLKNSKEKLNFYFYCCYLFVFQLSARQEINYISSREYFLLIQIRICFEFKQHWRTFSCAYKSAYGYTIDLQARRNFLTYKIRTINYKCIMGEFFSILCVLVLIICILYRTINNKTH